MQKLISLVLLLSSCFAIDPKALALGFTDSSHEEALNPVLIDTKVSINIEQANTRLSCASLQIQKDAELEFTKSSGIRATNVTIEAAKDMVINGKLTVSKGIDLTLISQSFVAEHAHIYANKLTVKSANINIIASEILSKKLSLGAKFFTKTIIFDQDSKILSKDPGAAALSFFAQDINAHGDIKACTGVIALHVSKSVNLDGLFVDFNALYTTSKFDIWEMLASDYSGASQPIKEDALDAPACGLIIDFDALECNLSAIYSGGAACEHSESLLSNIERLLGYTNVMINSNHRISLNSRLYSPILDSKISVSPKDIVDEDNPSFELTLSAPEIAINAEIELAYLFLLGISTSSKSAVHISPDCNILVEKLGVRNVNFKDAAFLPKLKYLYASISRLCLQSGGVLKEVYNHRSYIDVSELDESFVLEKYILKYNDYVDDEDPLDHTYDDIPKYSDPDFDKESFFLEPLLHKAKSVCFKNIYMDEYDNRIAGLIAKSIRAENSMVFLAFAKELKNVCAYRSIVDADMPSESVLQTCTMLGFVRGTLYKKAKKLELSFVTMDVGECLDLSLNTKELVVELSSINISSYANLSKVVRKYNSSIKCASEIPTGFMLDEYEIHDASVMDNALYQYAKKLKITGVTMDEDEFPELNNPLLASLTFKNCNLEFKEIVAKDITFENCKISGNYKAFENLTAIKTEFTLNADNILSETSIRLHDAKVLLTSNLDLTKIKAVNCNIDLKEFTIRANTLFHTSVGGVAAMSSFTLPFENCSFEGPGKLEMIHRLL